jgi:conjugal transfer pilus assembly protein TraF
MATLMRLLSAVLLLVAATLAHAGPDLDYPSVWTCDTTKLNWYCDPQEAPPPAAATQSPAAAEQASPKPLSISEIHTAEQLRQELKRREDLAVMEPTDEHMKNYLELWTMTQEKGAAFADMWRRVVWQNPEFDYALKRPTNTTASNAFDVQRSTKQDEQLRAVAQKHGLIFFFKSDCPYCHAMAPTIKMLADKYGIDVLPVSIDGGPLLPQYAQFTDGRAQAAAWGIERVPALFIGSKETGDHAPIGFGVISLDEIVNRIFVLTSTPVGQDF